LYVVDDHEGDLAATREPVLLMASFSCCFGMLLLPIAGVVQLLTRKKQDRALGNPIITMPQNTIPTTDELFLIRQGVMKPEDAKGVKPVKEVPPPFTNTHQATPIENKVEQPLERKNPREVQVADSDEEDWKAWDTG